MVAFENSVFAVKNSGTFHLYYWTNFLSYYILDVLANFDPIPNKWDLDLLNETDLIDYGSYQSGTFFTFLFIIIEYFVRNSHYSCNC